MSAIQKSRYRLLGRSGLRVSPICLGTMMFGGRADKAASFDLISRAGDDGVNFIDTADQYNRGASEEIIGEALEKRRHDFVLATKVGNPLSDRLNESGLSRAWIMRAAENSLTRLRTDFIDVYYLHLEDHDTPLETTISAIGDLIRQGKIRTFGVSNFRSWRIAEIVRVCDALGVDRPVVSQPYYNALNRQPEVEQLPVCGHYGMAVVPYSPLARGVLTGKYLPDAAPPEGSRAEARDVRMMESEWRPESLVIAQKIKAHAEARGITSGQFAVAWTLNNRLVTSVLAGPRTPAQWQDYITALDYQFTKEDETFMDSMVPSGHPSTPGYNDPRYPIEGRIARSGD